MTSLTYKDAGVDIKKADNALGKIKNKIQGTHNPFVLNAIGGFASLGQVPAHYKNPVLVSSTDGVGTKLKVAFMSGKHNTVGIDLVAMSVNDVLTMGAEPLFFLDYFACGRLEEKVYNDVISGICEGCILAGCALTGGETAEMPSFYKDGEYDLAGFVIGFVEKDKIINGSGIKEGDVIIALPSSGLHSNGFSLVRKALFEVHAIDVNEVIPELGGKLYEELLKPTRIYVKPVLHIINKYAVKGMAHITGGGLPGNIERILPNNVMAEIEVMSNRVPAIFRYLQRLGNVKNEDMCATFNMGIGFILIVDSSDAENVIKELALYGEDGYAAGRIIKKINDENVRVIFQEP